MNKTVLASFLLTAIVLSDPAEAGTDTFSDVSLVSPETSTSSPILLPSK
ncbi:MAG: hypothetical protein GKR93_01600 [Gammaproteobacteria bacterium]|nr:hypothetical protein [Gammaproteobacteria bacterium]